MLQCVCKHEKAMHFLENMIECLAIDLRKAKLDCPDESIRIVPSVVLGGKVNGYRLEPVFEAGIPVTCK